MNRLVQEAVLVGLARRLQDHGSWTGETHVQKASYLLRELRGIDFEFGFILYKHGPFSFGLRDELQTMRSERLLEQVIPRPGYGPQLRPTERGAELERRFERTMSRYGADLDWIAEVVGSRGVMDLERLATAMWMTREHPGASSEARAEALVRVKPHIPVGEAVAAVEEIDELLDPGADAGAHLTSV